MRTHGMVLLVLVLTCGCSKENASTTRATIGPEGGSLSSSDGQLTLTVPAGALSAAIELSITTGAVEADTLSAVYELGPSGTRFGEPAALALRFAAPTPLDAGVAGEETPLLATSSAGTWVPLGIQASVLDGAASELWALTPHLSRFAATRVRQEKKLPGSCRCVKKTHDECCSDPLGGHTDFQPSYSGLESDGTASWCECRFRLYQPGMGWDVWYPDFWHYWGCVRTKLREQFPRGCSDCLAECCRAGNGTLSADVPGACACQYRPGTQRDLSGEWPWSACLRSCNRKGQGVESPPACAQTPTDAGTPSKDSGLRDGSGDGSGACRGDLDCPVGFFCCGIDAAHSKSCPQPGTCFSCDALGYINCYPGETKCPNNKPGLCRSLGNSCGIYCVN